MVLDLLFGIAAAWTLAEGAHVVRGGMSTKEENEFDKKNGARGIDPREVVKIAQRNGVYPNKHGVLPAEPNSRIIKYVAQYANKPSDIDLSIFKEDGIDDVDFYIETNIVEGLKPLAKIVSGGEVSRIMLAFKALMIKSSKVEISSAANPAYAASALTKVSRCLT